MAAPAGSGKFGPSMKEKFTSTACKVALNTDLLRFTRFAGMPSCAVIAAMKVVLKYTSGSK